jgi:hypothetical protein
VKRRDRKCKPHDVNSALCFPERNADSSVFSDVSFTVRESGSNPVGVIPFLRFLPSRSRTPEKLPNPCLVASPELGAARSIHEPSTRSTATGSERERHCVPDSRACQSEAGREEQARRAGGTLGLVHRRRPESAKSAKSACQGNHGGHCQSWRTLESIRAGLRRRGTCGHPGVWLHAVSRWPHASSLTSPSSLDLHAL